MVFWVGVLVGNVVAVRVYCGRGSVAHQRV